MVSWRKARKHPPTAAIAAPSPNANSFAPATLIPRAAAARSLSRTATSRRPIRPRRAFAVSRPRRGQRHQDGHGVSARVRGRVDGVPEHRRWLHPGPEEAADERTVAEDELVRHDRQAEGQDGQLHSPRAQRRQRHEHPDRHRGGHGDEDDEQEGQAVDGREPAAHPCADPGQRQLRERELADVAGDHHDRQADDRHRHADEERGRPVVGNGERDRGGQRDCAEDRRPVDARSSEGRQPVEQLVAERQRGPARPRAR